MHVATGLSIRRRFTPFLAAFGALDAMNSFELNKILGALLGTCLVVLSMNIAANAIFSHGKLAKPGYDIAVPEKKSTGGEKKAAEPEVPLAERLAKADIGRGEAAHKVCTTCHTFDKGGRNLVGPNLWGVVGRKKGSHEGFNYSAGMKKMTGNWTPEDIDQFITQPKAMVPGTTMTFAGISRPQQRADIIAFLNSHSDKPLPLTKAAQAPGGGAAK
jgi:cytochrome c